MNAAALIVAAGRGTRAGGGLPKQYREIGGEAILARTVRRFLAAPSIGRVMVVIHPDDGALAAAALGDLPAETAHGGATRAASVRLGLEALAASPPDRVLIHDAARPFVSPAVIETITRALDRAPGACAAIPIVDALRRAENDCCGALIPREGAWRAQTPQGFRFADILSAHRAVADDDAPDDAEIARAAGLDVLLIESEADNFKITTPADFDRAGRLLAMSAPVEETRIGSGYDVHAFGPGDQVILCGVAVPHDRALVGHSDADVGLHAITDALLGALGLGDIGRWFPPSDPQWKGADSAIFLEAAVAEMARSGGRIVNLDVTLICERPKIGAHAGAMTARVAEICGIEQRRVNVKATTSERLGFTGREEGIAAMASASIAVRAQ